ncbi:flagellar hook protein FlgE [Desulfolutivibrio sulfoxidireducens]|uniref:flagellar hook protein FlgE n=1 Tax=Desulfolutivibrio sulfoxidireducens TaxID=2773299 RepID=UPI00159EA62C|nr:flagellar hook-basal body complex protein [Desulfolutivibrio sulfoxidireducens]QLA16195.1 flagellar hook-basal body complex protein [Desulfolutivibrio sulfoxidireducens]QLA19907.1 flagellar hook-basal body complex protein [Desulfolutivibrio sulfoxidireducens]
MGALWTGVTGLLTYSDGLTVTSNNLANVNTVGFKSSYTVFEDLMSTDETTSTGTSQVGLGVGIADILTNFTTGSMETTTTSMDMAIQGDRGYFEVKDADTGELYYTRAGEFRFDADGYLVDTNGMRVQGWAVDEDTALAAATAGTTLSTDAATGAVTDILIDDMTIAGRATSSLSLITNLDSTTESRTNDATNPYFTMFTDYTYDSADPETSPVSNASYQTTITTYDADGQSHELTVYYSKVSNSGGKEYWEYLVAMDPSEDGRSVVSGTSKAGVLMIGTITFNANGTMDNITAYTLSDDATDPTSLASWTQADISTDGLPQFSATYNSASGGGSTDPVTISFDLGISSTSGWSGSMPTTAAGVGTDPANTLGFTTADVTLAANATTNYATSSSTLSATQNGYAQGYLESVYVAGDGIVTGSYSNGLDLGLYVVALADFVNPNGLRNEGGNLYSATTEAGAKIEGAPGTGIFDEVAGYTLEASNVDIATEMVTLITLQRAFQSNSKVVTTADEMMKKAMEIKR